VFASISRTFVGFDDGGGRGISTSSPTEVEDDECIDSVSAFSELGGLGGKEIPSAPMPAAVLVAVGILLWVLNRGEW